MVNDQNDKKPLFAHLNNSDGKMWLCTDHSDKFFPGNIIYGKGAEPEAEVLDNDMEGGLTIKVHDNSSHKIILRVGESGMFFKYVGTFTKDSVAKNLVSEGKRFSYNEVKIDHYTRTPEEGEELTVIDVDQNNIVSIGEKVTMVEEGIGPVINVKTKNGVMVKLYEDKFKETRFIEVSVKCPCCESSYI